jgi:hypothetical protein
VLEEPSVTLGEAQLVLAGLAGLREADRQSAALALIAVLTARARPTWSDRSRGCWAT